RTVVALGPVPEHDFGNGPTLGVRHRDHVAVVSTVRGEPSREGALRHTSEGVPATICRVVGLAAFFANRQREGAVECHRSCLRSSRSLMCCIQPSNLSLIFDSIDVISETSRCVTYFSAMLNLNSENSSRIADTCLMASLASSRMLLSHGRTISVTSPPTMGTATLKRSCQSISNPGSVE